MHKQGGCCGGVFQLGVLKIMRSWREERGDSMIRVGERLCVGGRGLLWSRKVVDPAGGQFEMAYPYVVMR